MIVRLTLCSFTKDDQLGQFPSSSFKHIRFPLTLLLTIHVIVLLLLVPLLRFLFFFMCFAVWRRGVGGHGLCSISGHFQKLDVVVYYHYFVYEFISRLFFLFPPTLPLLLRSPVLPSITCPKNFISPFCMIAINLDYVSIFCKISVRLLALLSVRGTFSILL